MVHLWNRTHLLSKLGNLLLFEVKIFLFFLDSDLGVVSISLAQSLLEFLESSFVLGGEFLKVTERVLEKRKDFLF